MGASACAPLALWFAREYPKPHDRSRHACVWMRAVATPVSPPQRIAQTARGGACPDMDTPGSFCNMSNATSP